MLLLKDKLNRTREIFVSLSLIWGVLLLVLSFLPIGLSHSWLNIIRTIKEAILLRDSGHLILASALIVFFYSIQSTLLLIGAIILIKSKILEKFIESFDDFILSFTIILFFHILNPIIFKIPWEPYTTTIALIIALYLFDRLYIETNSFLQVFIVSLQVFFAIYWLNTVPFFTKYGFGQNDIYNSVKIVASYLNADSILNFVGLAFFFPFIIFAFVSATLFISYSQNINIMKINYEKENELRNIRSEALENRVYLEINSLVHDLKTPLVTIRGLNSLISSALNKNKLTEYSNRIENSIKKMNEMISCFLYETSLQRIKTTELISYIRAQLPLEDETIDFTFLVEKDLNDVYVNKIRVSRAIINILENAITVPCKNESKKIKFEVGNAVKGIKIMIEDNGIGIKELDVPFLWDAGFSTNNTSGLGLPFAKQVIENNGGYIKIKSEVNKGTRVHIFLPSTVE